MSFFNVQQRTSSGLSDIGQFPAEIVGSMGSAVIESGSNANGNYVKFADGTLICYQLNSVTKNGNFGASRYSYPTTFVDTYPKLFTQSEGITSQTTSGFRVTETNSYNTGYEIKLLQIEQVGGIILPDSGSIFACALGKWG